MPATLINQEFLDSNEQRSYPLAADASKTDITGGFILPDDFIVGIYLPIHGGLNVDPGKFFLRSVAIFSAGFRIVIAYDDGTDNPPTVATAVIPRSTHIEFDQYDLTGQGDFNDSSGRIVVGKLATIVAQQAGEYFFTLAGGKLEADAIQPMIQYVSGLVLVNGGNRSPRLTGDIELTAGNNIRFTVSDVDGSNPKVRIDAIDGAGLNEDCVCTETPGDPIRTINGIGPDTNGNFVLLGGTCVEISAISNGLKLVDTCSKPCCGCPELTALTDELQFFGSEARTTQNFINRLTSNVDNMQNVILGSTLSDQSCITCDTSN